MANESLVPVLIGVTTPFMVIAVFASIARVTIRTRKGKLGLDDGFFVFAVLCAIGYYVVFMLDIGAGALGRHARYLTPEQMSLHARYTISINDLYTWTVTGVKVSLAWTVLRIVGFSRRWRIGLYTLIAVLLAFALACSLVNWLQCIPLRAFWDPSISKDHCTPLKRFRDWVYGGSAFYLVTDLIFAVLPIALVLRIEMARREKVVLCGLMGLGIIATAAAIPKFISLRDLGVNSDWTWDVAKIDLWSLVEMALGIIAASCIAFRGALEHLLRLFGRQSCRASSGQDPESMHHWSSTSQSTTLREKSTVGDEDTHALY